MAENQRRSDIPCPSPPLKSAAAPAEGRGTPSLLMMGVVTNFFIAVGGAAVSF
jgi:hypothetical protein